MAEDGYGNETAIPKSEKSENRVGEFSDYYYGTNETTFQESSYVGDSLVKPYNPDDLVRKAGDYSIYENMLKDDQVSVALQLKKDLVLAAGFKIHAGFDDDQSKEIEEYLETCLTEYVEIPFIESLEEILSAYEFGFSLTEKVFKFKEDGQLGLKFLKTRHPASWLIHTDEHGNVEKYEQRGPNNSLDVEPKSLIHYTNNRKFQNPYGTSDLRPAYGAYFIKREVVKYYAIFLEKAASPIPVARYNKDAPQAAVDAIFSAIKKFQSKTALAIPKYIELEFLEAGNNGESYKQAIAIFNMFIGRSLFVPDLLGFQGAETSGGSYSLGKEQMGVLFKHINRRRQILEDIVNKEIIRPLVIYNYGNVEYFPKFKLNPVRDEELIELAKLWLEGAKSRVFKANDEEINHFRALAKFPEGEIEREEPQVPVGQIQSGMDLPNNEATSGEDKDRNKILPKIEDPEKNQTPTSDDVKSFKKIYNDTPGEYSKKVDFIAIENSMTRFENKVLTDIDPIVSSIIKDLKEQIRTKRIIQTQNTDKIEAINLKYLGKMEKVFRDNFKAAYLDAKGIAQKELFKGAKFAIPLLDQDFLNVLNNETFHYIGDDWAYQVKKKTRLELIRAIKDGLPISEIEGILDVYGDELTEVSITRYARTKFTEVMNRGRHAFFEESGVVAAYQYSAILDDRATDICSGLHGKIFKAGEEPIPPLHFNCRSQLVAITKFEEWSPDKRADGVPIEKFIDDNIGDGFSKQ